MRIDDVEHEMGNPAEVAVEPCHPIEVSFQRKEVNHTVDCGCWWGFEGFAVVDGGLQFANPA
ncbi:hypothetical protein M1247_13500 [Mycobacterium sp. 21AC1]|uniref:hypothetical protein n=1 Tax=[Mycobacterium] appelbergii TaxID=2939269 RepID=UPI0029392990|nr:hypothetical protein [Mycobacterium sp. 21AC1]MDV3125938.1 hypothetical protein [Mycobacterium sp. 21AC1]